MSNILFKEFVLPNKQGTKPKLELSSRIAMAPMTRSFCPDGVPGQNVADYYKVRAANGVGLIITEGTVIPYRCAKAMPSIPDFFGEKALQGWANVVKEVHSVGGKIVPQIWHIGSHKKFGEAPDADKHPISPSGLYTEDEKVGEPMTTQECEEVIQAYATAALDAKKIGFDGVELHGAHGYLIDQFFWGATNKRTDRFGGKTVRERTQFAVEVIKACREKVGQDFPIIFRFSQWKGQDYKAKLVHTPDELKELLMPLKEAGVDIFHCSTRRFWEPEFEGSSLNLAGWTKKITGLPTISVGSVSLEQDVTQFFAVLRGTPIGQDASNTQGSLEKLVSMMEKDEFDLIAVGRALISDPLWAKKVKESNVKDIVVFTKEALGKL